MKMMQRHTRCKDSVKFVVPHGCCNSDESGR
jgi:hypothetical protein